MKHTISAIALIIFLSMQSNAQSIEKNVIASGGKSNTVGNIQLDYTVGETFVKTFSTANNSVSQGFHQPNLFVARLSNPEDTASVLNDERLSEQPVEGIDLTVYPNPATDFINLKLNSSLSEPFSITVSNMQGQIVKNLTMQTQMVRIDFTNLVPGTYIITVKNGTPYNSYRVIKTN